MFISHDKNLAIDVACGMMCTPYFREYCNWDYKKRIL